MNMTILFLLLIAHVLADFYFQSDKMVEKKQTCISSLIWHSATYLILTLIFTIGYLTMPLALFLLGLSVFHFIVDWVFRNKNFTRLLIDQALHIAAIVFVVHMIYYISGDITPWLTYSEGILSEAWDWAMDPRRLTILFFILFNIKPANILIIKLLDRCGFNNEESPETGSNRGAVIGSLERLLTLILILCGEYLAGTLVVAIKSIGRIKKLDQPDFSDKFIIGSLFSLMIPVLSVIIINALP